jgi:hypothetical protein
LRGGGGWIEYENLVSQKFGISRVRESDPGINVEYQEALDSNEYCIEKFLSGISRLDSSGLRSRYGIPHLSFPSFQPLHIYQAGIHVTIVRPDDSFLVAMLMSDAAPMTTMTAAKAPRTMGRASII